MKAGIVTFNNAVNYGAVFQTYALQEFLKKMNFDVNVINYRSNFIEKCYSPFYISNKKVINGIARGLFFGKIMKLKKNEFDNFCNKYLNLTEEVFNLNDMTQYINDYDLFISGSDQVWSPVSANFDEFYFLPFAKKEQKFSYAASIGINYIDQITTKEYKRRLNEFPFYSVREDSAKKIIKEIFPNKEVFVNVDPTLLLSKKEWVKVSSKYTYNERYLLVFNVESEINDLEFAKKMAAKNNLKIYYINDRTLKKEKNIKYIEAPKPEEFLSLFNSAEMVITNSFHGTVFSVVFEKDFYVELENKKTRNIRSEALLNYLDINNRVIESDELKNASKIDWIKVRKLLDKKRKESIEYFELIKNRLGGI